jgi:hypothetical protein
LQTPQVPQIKPASQNRAHKRILPLSNEEVEVQVKIAAFFLLILNQK